MHTKFYFSGSVNTGVIRFLLPMLLLFFAACDLDGPYNEIPCRYNLTKLHDTLRRYGLSEWGEAPKGFHSKSAYNPSDLDCSSWEITLGIDSANNYFFNESFVMMLAGKVFNDPANDSFRHITFHLMQKIGWSATAELTYIIDRSADTAGLRFIPVSQDAHLTKKVSEGVADAGKQGQWKTVTLEINTIPANPYAIAKEYWLAHPQYQDIEIDAQYIPSNICKKAKYRFWFGPDAGIK